LETAEIFEQASIVDKSDPGEVAGLTKNDRLNRRFVTIPTARKDQVVQI